MTIARMGFNKFRAAVDPARFFIFGISGGDKLRTYDNTFTVETAASTQPSTNAQTARSLHVSPDKLKLATAFGDTSPLVYTLSTLATISTGITLPGMSMACEFSPDGLYLAIGHYTSPYISVFRVSDWAKLSNPASLPSGNVSSVAWSPDSSKLLCACENGSFKLYDVAAGALTAATGPATWSGSYIYAIAWSPDGTKIACVGDASPYVISLDVAGGYSKTNVGSAPGGYCQDVAWTPNSDCFYVACSAAPGVFRFEKDDLARTGISTGVHNASAQSIAVSSNGDEVALSGSTGIKFVTDDLAELVRSITSLTYTVTDMTWK